MSSEIWCSIITVVGVLLSAVIAYLTARSSAKTELKKMDKTHTREDSIHLDEMFTEMCKLVTKTIASEGGYYLESRSCVASIRPHYSGDMARHLDDLQIALRRKQWYQADDTLSLAIEEKRKELVPHKSNS